MNFIYGIRGLVYTFSIAIILLTLYYTKYDNNILYYDVITMSGIFMLILETLFTVDYLNKKQGKTLHNLFSHIINHLIYPVVLFIGISIYYAFRSESDTIVSVILYVTALILYFIHFTFLPVHLLQTETKKIEKTEYLLDFIFYMFKFISYFILCLSLFTAVYFGLIDKYFAISINLAMNFLYLYVHLTKNGLNSLINNLVALLFASITSVFIFMTFTQNPSFTATSSLIFYYIASSIFYHRVAGTLSIRVLIEYSSIALIASVLLFSLK